MGSDNTSKLMTYEEKIEELISSASGNETLGNVGLVMLGDKYHLIVEVGEKSEPKAIAAWAVNCVNEVKKHWPENGFTVFVRRKAFYRTDEFRRMTYFTDVEFSVGAYETLKTLIFETDDPDTRVRMIKSVVLDALIPTWWLYGYYANDPEFQGNLGEKERNAFETEIFTQNGQETEH